MTTHTATPRRCGLYLRISQDRTGRQAGVNRQEKDCRALCEHLGWEVAGVYRDNDISAFNGKRRPEYERLKADLLAGRIDAVVTWHPDRLYRRVAELEKFLELVQKAGVKMATVQAGDVDLSTPTGQAMAQMAAVFAQLESAHKAERVKAWHRQRAEAGLPNGGRRPFGYRPDRVTIDDDEAALIREAAARRLSGESTWSIVCDWRARGLTRPASGEPWTVATIGAVLRSPRVAGLRQHNGTLHPAVWDPILDRADWEQLRAMRRDNGVRGRPAKYLLAGLITCGRCGTPMNTSRTSPKGNGPVRTYACPARSHYQNVCGGVAVNAEKTEALVTCRVLAAFDGSDLAAVVAEKAGADDTTRDTLATLATLERRLDTLRTEYSVEGMWTKAEFVKLRGELEERITALSAKLPTNGPRRLPDGIDNLGDWWPGASVDDRRTVISTVVDTVVVHPVGRANAGRFNEDRIEVRWKS